MGERIDVFEPLNTLYLRVSLSSYPIAIASATYEIPRELINRQTESHEENINYITYLHTT
jgi:hypothetical protein